MDDTEKMHLRVKLHQLVDNVIDDPDVTKDHEVIIMLALAKHYEFSVAFHDQGEEELQGFVCGNPEFVAQIAPSYFNIYKPPHG